MTNTTRLYLTAFGTVTSLIYQPPHPWGASNSPVNIHLMLAIVANWKTKGLITQQPW